MKLPSLQVQFRPRHPALREVRIGLSTDNSAYLRFRPPISTLTRLAYAHLISWRLLRTKVTETHVYSYRWSRGRRIVRLTIRVTTRWARVELLTRCRCRGALLRAR